MKLTIIGASGHGRVVADIAVLCGYDEIEFLDDDTMITSCASWPVIGSVGMAREMDNDIFVAIGNGEIRKKLMRELDGKSIPVLVHPSAVVSNDVLLGRGSVVMAGAVINPGVRIGQGCIVNTASSIDHDCTLADFVHCSVGVHLSGNVTVGEDTWIGVGVVVSNNVNICPGCIIGAGAVVIRDIKEKGTYIGVPTKRMINKDLEILGVSGGIG